MVNNYSCDEYEGEEIMSGQQRKGSVSEEVAQKQ